jgi:hypothetical protein
MIRTATATAAVLAAPLLVPLLATAPPATAAAQLPAAPRAASSLACDVNGDGYADQPVGDWGAESVHLLRGSAKGLTGRGDQRLGRDSRAVAGKASRSDFFGYAVVCGNFDGDRFADVAVGVPSDHVGRHRNVGSVHVFPGSRSGLSTKRDRIIHRGTRGVPGVHDNGSRAFGNALATGDVNGDGRDDLVVDDTVLFGSRKGLHRGRAGQRALDATRLSGRPTPVVDDFDGDGLADVAALTKSGHAIEVAFGARQSTLPTSRFPSGNTPDERAVPTPVAGDVNGDGFADLVMIKPFDSADAGRGGVTVAFGAARPGTFGDAGVQPIDGSGVGGPAVTVGRAKPLAVADFDGDGHEDVVIDNVLPAGAAPGAEQFAVVAGGPDGIGPVRTLLGPAQPLIRGKRFTRSQGASTGDRNGDGRVDLSLGWRRSNRVGAMIAFIAGPNGLAADRTVFSPGRRGVARGGSMFWADALG